MSLIIDLEISQPKGRYCSFTVLCISNFTVFGKLAVVFLSVKIQKILIYGLKDQKNCHKFKHQNLQNSQGY